MRNFARINNHYNNIESWNDWNALAAEVEAAGLGELVKKHQPLESAKWRKVDKCLAALRADYLATQQVCEEGQSRNLSAHIAKRP